MVAMDKKEFIDSLGLIILIPLSLCFMFLFVIVCNSGNFFFVPDVGFFRLIIQIVSGLIAFGGAITFFVYHEIERRISELRVAIEMLKMGNEASVIINEKKGSGQALTLAWQRYDKSIVEWWNRAKKIIRYLVYAVTAFLFSIVISLGCIYAPVSEKMKFIGTVWAWLVLVLLGFGTGIIFLIAGILLKPIPK